MAHLLQVPSCSDTITIKNKFLHSRHRSYCCRTGDR